MTLNLGNEGSLQASFFFRGVGLDSEGSSVLTLLGSDNVNSHMTEALRRFCSQLLVEPQNFSQLGLGPNDSEKELRDMLE